MSANTTTIPKTCTRLHSFIIICNPLNSTSYSMELIRLHHEASTITNFTTSSKSYVHQATFPTHGVLQIRHVHHWKFLPWPASPEKGFTYVPKLDSSYSPHNKHNLITTWGECKMNAMQWDTVIRHPRRPQMNRPPVGTPWNDKPLSDSTTSRGQCLIRGSIKGIHQ